jgi:hypothetical protein
MDIKSLIIKYFINLVVITLAVFGAGLILFYGVPGLFDERLFLFIPYFFILSFLFHQYVLKSSAKNFKKFVPRFIGATTIKLMIYLITLLIVVLTIPEAAASIAIGFFVLYLIYTFFEVLLFLKQMKILNQHQK